MIKYFLVTCISLMVAAGFYGAVDMSRDLQNGRLIDYENVEYRHAKAILFIIKTTGIGTRDFIGLEKSEPATRKQRQEKEADDKTQIQLYMEDFGRGCIDC